MSNCQYTDSFRDGKESQRAKTGSYNTLSVYLSFQLCGVVVEPKNGFHACQFDVYSHFGNAHLCKGLVGDQRLSFSINSRCWPEMFGNN